MKKVRIWTVVIILALCFSAFAACHKKTPEAPIVLVDFEDEIVTAAHGTQYALPGPTVVDTNGKEYPVTYVVKTGAGQEVTVLYNAFTVTDKNGYVITATANLGSTKKTRTITVNVIDSLAPVITIATPPMGLAGKPYTLPEITIFDTSGEDIEPSCKVYFVSSTGDVEVTVTDNVFLPQWGGTYRLDVTATDSAHNTGYASAEILVRNSARPDEVISFDYERDLSQLGTFYSISGFEWLKTFEGEEGVAKINYKSSNDGAINFTPLQDYSAYQDYTYVVFRLYYEGPGTVDYLRLISADTSAAGHQYPLGYGASSPTEGAWVDYVFPIAPFLTGLGQVYFTAGTNGVYALYIADIYVTNADTIFDKVSVAIQGELVENEEITVVVNELATTEVAPTVTVLAPNGNAVTLVEGAFTAEEVGTYTVKVSCEGLLGTYIYKFTVMPAVDVTVTEPSVEGKVITLPVVTVQTKDGEPCTDAVIAMIVTYNGTKYTIGEGVTTLEVPFTGLTATISITVTVRGVEMPYTKTIKVPRADVKVREVVSFDSEADLYQIGNNYALTGKEWLETFEGEQGVAKLSYKSSNDGAIYFTPLQDDEAYSGYAYIVFRMYFEGPGTISTFRLESGTPTTVPTQYAQGYPYGTSPKAGEWVDYIFKIDPIFTGTRQIYFLANTNGVHSIYIADISVYKDMNTANVVIGTDGTLRVGSEITLTATLPGSRVTPHVLLLDPDGEDVTLDGTGKFTAAKAGTYTVKVTCDGYIGTFEDTFVVNPDVDITVGEPSVDVKVITLPTVQVDGVVADYTVTYTVTYNGQKNVVEAGHTTYEVPYMGYRATIEVKVTYNGGIEFTVIKSIDVPRVAESDKEVISFDYEEDLNRLTKDWSSPSFEWLEEYMGEKGVAKISYGTKNDGAINFIPVQANEAYSGYAYIVFRMYFEGPGTIKNFYLAAGNKYAQGYPSGTSLTAGAWVDYVFEVGTVFTGGAKQIYFVTNLDGAFAFYIADISVYHGIEALNVAVGIEGTLRVGSEITVTATTQGSDVTPSIRLLDPDGEDVTLDGAGKFTAAKAGTYTVKVTCEGYIGTFEETFVVDPDVEITVGEPSVDGKVITLPTVTVQGATNHAVTYTVTYNGQTHVVEAGHTTYEVPSMGYQATIEVEVTYNGNKTYKVTKTVLVPRVAESDTEVVSFDYEVDINQLTKNWSVTSFEWLSEYEGEQGVAKINFNLNKDGAINFTPLRANEAYSGYAYIVFRMYFDGPDTLEYFRLEAGKKYAQGYPSGTSPTKGCWVDYVFDVGTVFTGGAKQIYLMANSAGAYTFYIADIYVTNEIPYGKIEENGVLSFDAPTDLDRVTAASYATSGKKWLGEFEGEKGVVKLDFKSTGDGYFTFNPLQANEAYGEYTYIVFRMYFEGPGTLSKFYLAPDNATGLYAQGYPSGKSPTEGFWMDYVFEIGTTFTEGKNKRIYFSSPNNGAFTFYIADIYVTKEIPHGKIEANGVVSFDAYSDINQLPSNWSKPSIEWLGAYEGEKGVAKISYGTKDSGAINFTPLQDDEAYSGYAYIVFRMYFEGPGTIKKFYHTAGNKYAQGYPSGTSLTAGAWVDYVFEVGNLFTGGTKQIYFETNSDGAFAFYIADIYVTNEIPYGKIEENGVLSADAPTDLGRITGTFTSKAWLPTYEGETGVVKLNYNSTSSGSFTFNPLQANEAYGEYTYIVFRMYFEGPGTLNKFYLTPDRDTGLYAKGYPRGTSPTADAWVDYVFDIGTTFTEGKNKQIYFETPNDGAFTFYIADIYVTNEIPN